MSLSRAVLLLRQRPVTSLIARRNASSSSHDNHHHEDASEHYPREEFSGPFWRNTILVSLLVAAAYKWAPEATEDTYLTRWMALYSTSRDRLMDIAVKHTALSAEGSDVTLMLGTAKPAPVRRYRYPQQLDKSSTFQLPIGEVVDTSGLVVKRD